MAGFQNRPGVPTTAAGPTPPAGDDDEAPLRLGPYLIKRAETAAELEQVHRLNYETFVGEVHQYDDPGTGRLVDKFHHKNRYWIATRDGEVVGMVAAHDRPPFSIADRLPAPLAFDRPGERPLEVRLLAVRPDCRQGPLFFGLLGAIHDHARRQGHTLLLISGVVERVAIYEKLGFRALGPAVACGHAAFVPMGLDLAEPPRALRRFAAWWDGRHGGQPPAAGAVTRSLLPGPVEIAPKVRQAWGAPPISHRGDAFVALFERARGRLERLVGGASRAALFCGSGTLANDVVAAALAGDRTAGSGLILVNGEFGVRLARQAARAGLKFRVLRRPWGRRWDLDAVAEALAADRGVGWIWGVHLETSTGMINDLEGLRGVAVAAGVRICLDCVSGLGAVPCDLSGVHLASASSGKALGAYAGLGIVFAGPEFADAPASRRVPAALDLRAALGTLGPRHTFASPLVAALDRALDDYDEDAARVAKFAHFAALGRATRAGLRGLGLRPIARGRSAAPVVTSFAPPAGVTADAFAAACRALGYEVAHASDYLRRRGWVQIATMGDVGPDDLHRLFGGLARRFGGSPPGAAGSTDA